MDGRHLTLWVSAAVVLGGAVWICVRDLFPAFKPAEDPVFEPPGPRDRHNAGVFGEIHLPVALWEAPREKVVLPELPPLTPLER